MRIIYKFIFILFAFAYSNAEASSLDELYRDIIRSDNQGYLPMFVKNRNIPDILVEEEILKRIPDDNPDDLKTSNQKPLNLINNRPDPNALRKAIQLKWDNTLKAVAENRVTPVELKEIEYRVQQNDPKAVEVMAWMYTKGVGVSPDYIKAFHLYRKASELQIPKAEENASLVYKAMNEEQRRSLKEN